MANITAKDVASLRAKTGIGMMECKKALVEANGDAEEAIKILRKRGELKAEAKAATRIAADGIVDVMTADGVTAIVEVNSETDFVAKNATFQEFVKEILKTIIANKPADVDALLASNYVAGGTVAEALSEQIYKIGEKLSIRRFVIVEGVVSSYIHGMGATGVVVSFATDLADKDGFKECAKNVALQVAAMPVLYLNKESVPAADLEAEKQIQLTMMKNDPKNANKPESILEKMIMGKMNKFYEENCLTNQAFVKENKMSVEKYADKVAAEQGGTVKIAKFVRFEKGETKINASTLFPHDIVNKYTHGGSCRGSKDATIEALWKALPNTVNGCGNTIVVADGSGSMTSRVDPKSSVSALDVANAMAIYFAERSSGQFKNKYITFSERPQLVDFSKCNSLHDKLRLAETYDEVANTNIEKVFDLILTSAVNNRMGQDELPANVLIISDMEFDRCVSNAGSTNFKNAKAKFEVHGYNLPDIVFWNVASRNQQQPVKVNDKGVALVSGCNPRIFSMLKAGILSPYAFMMDVLGSERYAPIVA